MHQQNELQPLLLKFICADHKLDPGAEECDVLRCLDLFQEGRRGVLGVATLFPLLEDDGHLSFQSLLCLHHAVLPMAWGRGRLVVLTLGRRLCRLLGAGCRGYGRFGPIRIAGLIMFLLPSVFCSRVTNVECRRRSEGLHRWRRDPLGGGLARLRGPPGAGHRGVDLAGIGMVPPVPQPKPSPPHVVLLGPPTAGPLLVRHLRRSRGLPRPLQLLLVQGPLELVQLQRLQLLLALNPAFVAEVNNVQNQKLDTCIFV
mmetsp:Transcript_108047/g.182739  ORF Transcript_108047/g.182739 Transcript_108047/m.182739 type:complete len:257 (-) Transcript_108047:2651-3421(-)